MFKQKRRREAAITTLVGSDTRVHGDLEFKGGCLVDGFVKGNVKAVDDENATLSISERGCVEGAVMVPNVLLNGTVRGDVKATQRVELGSNARVVGNVQYSLIEMAIGAEVNGKLIHESEASQRKAAQARNEMGVAESDDGQADLVAELSPKVNMVGE
jgi:cytoskeletal protein CcmA (bactofilin family)